ncbi:MAG: hypothetical protein ABI347_09675 [Nitrososphaera sp.]|jgi:hypothetical protein
MIQKARCGHEAPASFAEAHGGLCRRCHSSFAFLVDMEKKYGEDALVQYWYSMILARLPETKQEVHCFISHLVEFYKAHLMQSRPSKRRYIEKMLYMLRSIEEPFDGSKLR